MQNCTLWRDCRAPERAPLRVTSPDVPADVFSMRTARSTQQTTRSTRSFRTARDFAAGADGTYVFNCVLMQNPMCETMMRFGMTTEQSLGFIREICAEIQPLDPVVIYLKSTDPAALMKAALPERGNDCLNAVIYYHCNGAYGRFAGLNGFDGYIAALRERQRRELEMLPKLPVKNTILDDPQSDWERVYQKIGEFLDQN